ncbi:hypothetical protein MIND_01131800 [Mycena indigotica]|uniref:Uncharacterized protein n=1 Tax=Mycena indigotica TaxID=2126181 RepID=A0A8H6VTP1_9AGAR|nr:uncharacterized protein MIND_01131800 [Mycena indigotica]KAF7293534.1 hypothetical protein MIND_01131800 [Mycena indigotica]
MPAKRKHSQIEIEEGELSQDNDQRDLPIIMAPKRKRIECEGGQEDHKCAIPTTAPTQEYNQSVPLELTELGQDSHSRPLASPLNDNDEGAITNHDSDEEELEEKGQQQLAKPLEMRDRARMTIPAHARVPRVPPGWTNDWMKVEEDDNSDGENSGEESEDDESSGEDGNNESSGEEDKDDET